MSYYGKDLLLKFIDSQGEVFEAIFNAINSYGIYHKTSVFRKEALKEGFLIKNETDISFVFADSVVLNENEIKFDLIIDAEFYAQYKGKYDYEYDDESIWLRLSCKMIITDKLEKFKIYKINEYSRKNYNKDTHQATASLVPIISREQYDVEAEQFLKKHYPIALTTPMPIPIENIVKQMGLNIVKDKLLTADHSIFGQICFMDGLIKTYDEVQNQYIDMDVKRGTIFIDPQTYYLRNVGCVNNTIAHEAFHWKRHRLYATIKSLVAEKPIIAQRCPTYQKNNSVICDLTDEDWLEIQANAIAPKILMPKNMTEQKIRELINKYNYIKNGDNFEKLKQIIDELSEFFEVSKQAARIRMLELGYHEASEVYNFDSETSVKSNEISALDAFVQYNENKDFKALFNLDLFRLVDEKIVINSPKYLQRTENGLMLTEYAKNNLNECTLEFEQNIEIIYDYNRKNGVLYREFSGLKSSTKFTNSSNNKKVIDIALEVEKFIEEHEHTKDFTSQMTVAQCIAHLMNKRKWNSAIFAEKTELGQNFYSRIKNHPNTELKLRTLISICIGLGYSAEVSKLLLERAGHTLRKNIPQEQAYSFLLTNFVGKSISCCNELLSSISQKIKCDIEFLGASEYKNTRLN